MHYREGSSDNRGVVTWAEGCDNSMAHLGLLAPVKNEVKIRLGAGYTNFTTYQGEWLEVPAAEWTATERVWHAIVAYRYPDWYATDARVPDHQTFAWAMAVSMLPPKHAALIFGDGDWLTDFQELAEAVARCQDFDSEADKVSFT